MGDLNAHEKFCYWLNGYIAAQNKDCMDVKLKEIDKVLQQVLNAVFKVETTLPEFNKVLKQKALAETPKYHDDNEDIPF